MRKIFVRPARKEDRDEFIQWSINTQDNGFDPDVITYRNTSIRCAFDRSGALAYMPIQRPLVLESLALRPDLSDLRAAAAIEALARNAIASAKGEGSGEVYFLGSNENTNNFAKRHGFEERPWKVYRIRVKDTEAV